MTALNNAITTAIAATVISSTETSILSQRADQTGILTTLFSANEETSITETAVKTTVIAVTLPVITLANATQTSVITQTQVTTESTFQILYLTGRLIVIPSLQGRVVINPNL